jgi:hypothetical protein
VRYALSPFIKQIRFIFKGLMMYSFFVLYHSCNLIIKVTVIPVIIMHYCIKIVKLVFIFWGCSLVFHFPFSYEDLAEKFFFCVMHVRCMPSLQYPPVPLFDFCQFFIFSFNWCCS